MIYAPHPTVKTRTYGDGINIAVLPFVNLSGDPEQEYFSDGFTENIITGLSSVEDLFVIARNSTFTYKGKPINVKGSRKNKFPFWHLIFRSLLADFKEQKP